MNREELGIALYDEVSERTGGLDADVVAYDNLWTDLSPGERRAVEGTADVEVVELLEGYAEAVEAYNDIGGKLYGSSPERTAIVTGMLPEEMVLEAETGDRVYLAAPGEDDPDGDAILFTSWLQRWNDRIRTADGYERFERKLEQAGFAGHDTATEDALYAAWDDAGIDWGLQLWGLLHVPEIAVTEKWAQRRERSAEVAGYAEALEEYLDPANGVLEAGHDESGGLLERLRAAFRR